MGDCGRVGRGKRVLLGYRQFVVDRSRGVHSAAHYWLYLCTTALDYILRLVIVIVLSVESTASLGVGRLRLV